jgi:hypothetical protein
MTMPPGYFAADWARLWRLAERLAVATGGEPESVFAPVGLFLGNPAEARAWGYDSTPANATTFASTGGDGVHFSAVDCEGAAPIVMTVPMAFDHPNQVLAGDLREFLALGANGGYFFLERLAYDWGRQDTIAWLEGPPPPAEPTEAALLGHLGAEFALQPRRDLARRFMELEATYRPYLLPRRDG